MASIDAGERATFGLRAVARANPSTVRDLLLVGLTVASGAADAIGFLGLDKVFTAFMTGNLVFIGLIAAGAKQPHLTRVAPALVAFAGGVFVAVRIAKRPRGAGIWPQRVSVALGVGAFAQAAFLGGWLVTSGRPSSGAGDLLI